MFNRRGHRGMRRLVVSGKTELLELAKSEGSRTRAQRAGCSGAIRVKKGAALRGKRYAWGLNADLW